MPAYAQAADRALIIRKTWERLLGVPIFNHNHSRQKQKIAMPQTKTTAITRPSPKLVQLFDLLRRRQAETIIRLKHSDMSKCDEIANMAVKDF